MAGRYPTSVPSDSHASAMTGPSTGPSAKQPPLPSPTSPAPPSTVAPRPASRTIHPSMPVTVLLPLVPATATPGWPSLTISASSWGRDTRSTPSARAARISGVSASTAVENTKRSTSGVIAVPSWGQSAMPRLRSRRSTSAF